MEKVDKDFKASLHSITQRKGFERYDNDKKHYRPN